MSHHYNPQGTEYHFNFNPDLSGDIHIVRVGTEGVRVAEEIHIPAEVIQRFFAHVIADQGAVGLLNDLRERVAAYVDARPDDCFSAALEARGVVGVINTDLECRTQRTLDRVSREQPPTT